MSIAAIQKVTVFMTNIRSWNHLRTKDRSICFFMFIAEVCTKDMLYDVNPNAHDIAEMEKKAQAEKQKLKDNKIKETEETDDEDDDDEEDEDDDSSSESTEERDEL